MKFARRRLWVKVTVAREIARLYGGVKPFGETVAMVIVYGPSSGPFYRYEASL